MSFLNDTDDEMNRYEEAAVLRQGATPSMITNMRSVFNTDTGKTDLLAPLPSGGFAKVASEAPQIMVEEPTMPLAEPLPVDDSEIALQSIRDYQSGTTDKDGIFTPTQMSRDDYLAAGYTDQQIDASGIMGQTQQKTGRSEPLSTEEITTILSNGESVFESYDPTMRENGAANLTETLVNLRIDERREELISQQIDSTEIERILSSEQPEMLSLSQNLADVVFGNRNVLGTGFADFATAGVMDMQEGWRMYTQALRTDSSLDRGLGILLMAAGAAEATGVGFLLGKTIKSAIPKVREGLQAMGASAQTRITERGTGTTMMSGVDPTVITDPLVAAAGRAVTPVKPQSPSLPYNINLTEVTDPALVPSARAASRSLSQAEQDVVTAVFPDNPDGAILEMGKIAKTKSAFPVQDGWSGNVELLSVGFKKNGNTDVNFKKVPYNFHNAPKDVDPVKWKQSIQRKTLKEVRLLATRAANGDPQALKILQEASWYRDMRARMRLEFGGLGDVYADLLGTTSAQTGVEQNWDNAIEIMRRFSRGEFDEEIAMYEAKLAAGETNPVKLGQAHNDENNPFKLIAKASGSLFNANSPSSTKALLNMFRVAKGAPKTPNFTGNLIGYTSAATVDVWAARFLNRMTGRPRLAPPTEQGVSGDHLAGSTLENPKVGAEFGFGQEVIQAVADNINKSGILRAIDPGVGNVGADDLQAIMWFMEKEIWTNKGWTSKAGEGGSFDLEASYAGASDPDAVKAARKIANATFKPPTPLKQKTGETDVEYQARLDAQLEGAQQRFDAKTSQAATDLETAKDPAEIKKITKIANATFKPPAPAKRKPRETNADYTVRSDLRFDEAKQKHDDAVAKASKELEGYKQPLARWVLGVSIERPNKVPTNAQQADAAARLGEPAKADDAVVMYQINNSLGRFMGTNERNFNAEFVVRENFDPAAVMARMMEVAKETDQDAAFMSKVLAERSATSRPGAEIYFKKRKDAEFADLFSDELKELGVDGFTYVTDSRVMDQPGRQAQQNEDAIAGLTGIRFQYIPEFDMGADAWNALSDAERAAKIDQMEELYINVLLEIQAENPDISSATLMHYETTVGERGGYDQFRAPAN